MKLGIISLGCAKNLVDSELFLGLAKKYGLEITNKIKDADIIAINTCGFILPAKQESIDTIIEMLDYQKDGKIIIVMGCLVERYLNELKQEIPEVDYFIPIKDYGNLDKIFSKITSTNLSEHLEYTSRIIATNKGAGYLRIGEGCNNRCAYCAIPLIRGNYVSRTFDSLILEAKYLAENGVVELTLIAQDTTRYGSDMNDMSLAKLLKALEGLNLFKVIRVLYLYPDEITDELIKVMTTSNVIIPYFDIPIQHASNKILKAMNRRGTKEELYTLFEKIRSSNPDAVIRTTLIVGFPGETSEDFEELLNLVNDIKFDHLGVFEYSDEDDTKAFHMTPKITDEVKHERFEKIMTTQQKISLGKNTQLVGKTFESLLVKPLNTDTYLFRAYFEAPDDSDGYIKVKINDKNNLIMGEYYKVKITKAMPYDLEGELQDI